MHLLGRDNPWKGRWRWRGWRNSLQAVIPFTTQWPPGGPGCWWRLQNVMSPSACSWACWNWRSTFPPAIKFTDLKHTKRVSWKANEYVELTWQTPDHSPWPKLHLSQWMFACYDSTVMTLQLSVMMQKWWLLASVQNLRLRPKSHPCSLIHYFLYNVHSVVDSIMSSKFPFQILTGVAGN